VRVIMILLAAVGVFTIATAVGACAIVTQPYQEASGVLPQVVLCARQHPEPPASDNWKPPVRVRIETNRGPGRIREFRVSRCTLYYYHDHLR
jgi:hypothetical protein